MQTKKEKTSTKRPKSAPSVVDRLSKPKNASGKILDASKSVVLSSEDQVMAKIKEAKKARASQVAKSRKAASHVVGEFVVCTTLIYSFNIC